MSFDELKEQLEQVEQVSIPFEQGDVFRQDEGTQIYGDNKSQSLSSRAMSFDCIACTT